MFKGKKKALAAQVLLGLMVAGNAMRTLWIVALPVRQISILKMVMNIH